MEQKCSKIDRLGTSACLIHATWLSEALKASIHELSEPLAEESFRG